MNAKEMFFLAFVVLEVLKPPTMTCYLSSFLDFLKALNPVLCAPSFPRVAFAKVFLHSVCFLNFLSKLEMAFGSVYFMDKFVAMQAVVCSDR